jgi:hypothetical protein
MTDVPTSAARTLIDVRFFCGVVFCVFAGVFEENRLQDVVFLW